ncbi:hypothetical protein I3842_02G021100 [Carya illinoinensis]|uniref:Uncharacterized protein n=1 Tax=Carya illinoinensis TaxID=32201 RepID=A0A922K324_CARIL|nr:hypothetical protein I3842_02G021100 [Carya illinoinensis]
MQGNETYNSTFLFTCLENQISLSPLFCSPSLFRTQSFPSLFRTIFYLAKPSPSKQTPHPWVKGRKGCTFKFVCRDAGEFIQHGKGYSRYTFCRDPFPPPLDLSLHATALSHLCLSFEPIQAKRESHPNKSVSPLCLSKKPTHARISLWPLKPKPLHETESSSFH